MADKTADFSTELLDGKYLTFRLGEEEYGVEIMKIREIIGLMPITSVPQTPQYVKGIINLRGKVIPVVDLRLRFRMTETVHSEKTCIIVLDISRASSSFLIGVIVDSVSEVMSIKNVDIEKPPSFGMDLNTDYIQGMAKAGDSVKMLLDINRVLSEGDMPGLLS